MKKKDQYVLAGSLLGAALVTAGAIAYFKNRTTIPEGATPVKPFNAKKYMGKWYEIARLDYRFEKGLDNVTAEYVLNSDGTIKVINTGYNYRKGIIEQAIGKARPAGSSKEGKLKVSFWGPFWDDYNVIAIDKGYKYAMVAGRNLNYLWLLSRETSIPDDIKETYLQQAKDLGYKIENLIWSEHVY